MFKMQRWETNLSWYGRKICYDLNCVKNKDSYDTFERRNFISQVIDLESDDVFKHFNYLARVKLITN